MRCNRCREWNSEEEHRCRRCGRRLETAGGFDAPAGYGLHSVNLGATAHKFEVFTQTAVAEEPAPAPNIVHTRLQPTQSTLFGRGEGQKVVSIAPEAPAAPAKRASAKRGWSSGQHSSGAEGFTQQQLQFPTPEKIQRRHTDTNVEAVIYCTDPVATIMHRLLASVADAVMIMIAVGLFTIAFYLSGGEIKLNNQTVFVYAAIPVIIGLFYKYLWAIAGADSPGMAWAGLRTVNFDGKKPEPLQRFVRLCGGCLGLAAVAIGFVWAFVDEETLTWHDHISNTFTTPI